MENHPANMKHSLIHCLGDIRNYKKTLLCITASIYTGRENADGSLETKDFNLKRGYTPEDFGRFLHDLDFILKDYRDHIGIIVWYTDGTWSWSSEDEENNRLIFENHHRPDPDKFNL
mgnify:CR=1 FL=1